MSLGKSPEEKPEKIDPEAIRQQAISYIERFVQRFISREEPPTLEEFNRDYMSWASLPSKPFLDIAEFARFMQTFEVDQVPTPSSLLFPQGYDSEKLAGLIKHLREYSEVVAKNSRFRWR